LQGNDERCVVCSADTPHNPTENPKTSLFSNLSKIYSEQITLKALQKSLRQPPKVPASLRPAPHLPPWSAWGEGTGTCSAPRGASPWPVEPLCTLCSVGRWHGASSRLLDSGRSKAHPTRHRRRGVRRAMNARRGCGPEPPASVPVADREGTTPHSLVRRSVRGQTDAEPGRTPTAVPETWSSCVVTAALTTRARAVCTKTARMAPLHR